MKLSTNFTLFGLNVKAIQSYLKEQAKDRRGVRVTRRGDLVYIITAYTAFKLPAVLYPDVIQPVTLRECPADGVTIISAQYGFEVEENAPDLVDIFKNHAPNEKPVEDDRDGYTYRENVEAMRVQLVFDGKPDDETRTLLKRNGFKWAPSQGAWQRQLNDAGKYAAHRVMEVLDGQQ